DRFGLSVEVASPRDVPTRVEVVKRRDAFDRDRVGFCDAWEAAQAEERERIVAARGRIGSVATPDEALALAAELCLALGADGLRGELTLIRAARAIAALEGAGSVGAAHLRAVAPSALRHRLRRDPLDEAGSEARVARAVDEVMPA
ncbi:MAG TPA: magnesium chelatase ATPase subunit I, partial [Paracoccaceae bacterium]|nr:magnesium chelatase ATPase subunit I [Paracoccaceae bacterium]